MPPGVTATRPPARQIIRHPPYRNRAQEPGRPQTQNQSDTGWRMSEASPAFARFRAQLAAVLLPFVPGRRSGRAERLKPRHRPGAAALAGVHRHALPPLPYRETPRSSMNSIPARRSRRSMRSSTIRLARMTRCRAAFAGIIRSRRMERCRVPGSARDRTALRRIGMVRAKARMRAGGDMP